jgi:hypothetical protein
VVGVPLCAALLALARWRRSDELAAAASLLLVAIAIVAWAPYLSGEGAEEAVEDLAGVSHELIEGHEDAAQIAFVLVELLGAASLVHLLLARRRGRPGLAVGLLVMSLVTTLLLIRAASLGGEIRHTELRGALSAPVGSAQGHVAAADSISASRGSTCVAEPES